MSTAPCTGWVTGPSSSGTWLVPGELIPVNEYKRCFCAAKRSVGSILTVWRAHLNLNVSSPIAAGSYLVRSNVVRNSLMTSNVNGITITAN